ncbi:HipA N-terminal domain-containing protein [Flavobacterium piscisymbiosum]|uniref:HipA N-terminal domain-containing protein n=1 Tax=Flavobacterium piscisymbiosum TaxID=2893753 RepID=UPI003D1745C1
MGDMGFTYDNTYRRESVLLTMLFGHRRYSFSCFPPFFEGLLPEWIILEGLLRINEIDYFPSLLLLMEIW